MPLKYPRILSSLLSSLLVKVIDRHLRPHNITDLPLSSRFTSFFNNLFYVPIQTPSKENNVSLMYLPFYGARSIQTFRVRGSLALSVPTKSWRPIVFPIDMTFKMNVTEGRYWYAGGGEARLNGIYLVQTIDQQQIVTDSGRETGNIEMFRVQPSAARKFFMAIRSGDLPKASSLTDVEQWSLVAHEYISSVMAEATKTMAIRGYRWRSTDLSIPKQGGGEETEYHSVYVPCYQVTNGRDRFYVDATSGSLLAPISRSISPLNVLLASSAASSLSIYTMLDEFTAVVAVTGGVMSVLPPLSVLVYNKIESWSKSQLQAKIREWQAKQNPPGGLPALSTSKVENRQNHVQDIVHQIEIKLNEK